MTGGGLLFVLAIWLWLQQFDASNGLAYALYGLGIVATSLLALRRATGRSADA
jgi:hypothetical protein